MMVSCSILKKKKEVTQNEFLPPLEFNLPSNSQYRASETKTFDLVHTKLGVDFDWTLCRMNGKAEITLHPHFFPTQTLELDAKGFDIKSVELIEKGDIRRSCSYTYDSLVLKIDLGRSFSRTDTCLLAIEYLAKPNEFKAGGSKAITSDKGLYFINPDGKELNKPRQIWTQGETESSSRWFPTIDAPNQKMTQEIAITVDKKFLTVSNGTLIYSSENTDGTRTDHWKQDKPHAPYLAMMAVGEFYVYKDEWTKSNGQTIPLQYILDQEYAPYVKQIFGNTPEMIGFYSKKLGVDYVWDKYDQIVVHDYVSGAMENTGAVIFGDQVEQTDREMLDKSYEYIVAHELFHHWFGDLVTCESWSNLPLNESFADYAQYLWDEHKYGRDEADYNLWKNWNQYLDDSKNKQVSLIRFEYEKQDDMFDSHSYEKGGCILHMLRKYVGDEAFFESLKLYLTKNKFKSAEIHHLRLAFEEVTGEDLNWFFNQWFLRPGHPYLEVSYRFDSIQNTQYIYTSQTLSGSSLFGESFNYRIPVNVDLYTNSGILHKKIVIENALDTFTFQLEAKPEIVNFDADKAITSVKIERKEAQEWVSQFHKAPLWADRMNALANLVSYHGETQYTPILLKALHDPHWSVRQTAVLLLERIDREKLSQQEIAKLVLSDPSSKVRMSAIWALNEIYKDSISINFYQNLLDDPSYGVIKEALEVIYQKDKVRAIETAQNLEREKNATLRSYVLSIYAQEGVADKNNMFLDQIAALDNYEKASVLMNYKNYILHEHNLSLYFDNGIKIFEDEVLGQDPNHIKLYSIMALKSAKMELKRLSDQKTEKTPMYLQKLNITEDILNRLKLSVKDPELSMYLTEDELWTE